MCLASAQRQEAAPLLQGTYIPVAKQASHQSLTHACKMCTDGLFVLTSNKISYCNYVHPFTQYAVSGSMLKQPYQTTWIFTLEHVKLVRTQSDV